MSVAQSHGNEHQHAVRPSADAVVTGGGRGIGAAIAEALARLGASVSLIGRNAEVLQFTADRIIKEHGVKVATASADVADEQDNA